MPILPNIPGIAVFICVEERPLREYPDWGFRAEAGDNRVDLAPTTVSTYVQSDTKEFDIRLRIGPQFNFDFPALGFEVYIDGFLVKSPLARRVKYEEKNSMFLLVDGVKYAVAEGQHKRCVKHMFRFSKIDTTADDNMRTAFAEDYDILSQIGEIVVKVFRRDEPQPIGAKIVEDSVLDDHPTVVHETAMKGDAKSHGTSLGDAEACEKFDTKFAATFLDGENHPIAAFRFKYRDRKALQSLMVIPKTPEPEQPQVAVASPDILQPEMLPLERLGAAERVQFQALLRKLQSEAATPPKGQQDRPTATLVMTKNDDDDFDIDPTPLRKRRQQRKNRTIPVVIDLTND